MFNTALQEFVRVHADAFDYLELMPDTHWLDQPREGGSHFVDDPEALAFIDRLRDQGIPMVIHGLGLSIGSADHFPLDHVGHIADWVERYRCAWHSDHLASTRISTDPGQRLDVGFPMAVPYDAPVLEMIIERITAVQTAIPVPFLLENNVYYYTIPEQDMSEAAFLNALCRRTGCGLLLDLHNLYANARNHGFDPYEFLAEIDLDTVVEIHVAGGIEWGGFWLDAHSGASPPEVWSLLDWVLPRAHSLRGVTFELFPAWYDDFGPKRLLDELARLRATLASAAKEPARVTG